MNIPCPKCGTLNLISQIFIPYYLCDRCDFGHEVFQDFKMKRIGMDEYHQRFRRIVSDIETQKMIEGVK